MGKRRAPIRSTARACAREKSGGHVFLSAALLFLPRRSERFAVFGPISKRQKEERPPTSARGAVGSRRARPALGRRRAVVAPPPPPAPRSAPAPAPTKTNRITLLQTSLRTPSSGAGGRRRRRLPSPPSSSLHHQSAAPKRVARVPAVGVAAVVVGVAAPRAAAVAAAVGVAGVARVAVGAVERGVVVVRPREPLRCLFVVCCVFVF